MTGCDISISIGNILISNDIQTSTSSIINSSTLPTVSSVPTTQTPSTTKPTSTVASSIIAQNRSVKDEEIIANFKNGDTSTFQKSTWSNDYPFNCRWSADNIKFSNGTIKLSLNKKSSTYYGSEYASKNNFSFGYFATNMKPIRCPGVISSFFIYTGDPWDEIDIEFLGKDTTKVQFNYFTNGVGNHEYIYDLGFDASKEFHEYGFEWKEDSIIWFVDGKAVYKATKDIPQTPAKIMMNVWNVHEDYASWAGKFTGENLPVTAEYKFVAYGKNS